MRKMNEALRFLSVMPGPGHLLQDLTDQPVKFWQVFSYSIVCGPLTRPIGIARVLHSSRDGPAILAGRTGK
jgi:hypothetical protein